MHRDTFEEGLLGATVFLNRESRAARTHAAHLTALAWWFPFCIRHDREPVPPAQLTPVDAVGYTHLTLTGSATHLSEHGLVGSTVQAYVSAVCGWFKV